MSELPDLSGRVALVTGASRGIGYAVSVALAKAGAHVIAVARTVGGLEELDDAIQAAGGQATLVPFDLKDTDAIDRLGAAIFERWKRLDILFANAGMLGPLTPVGHIKPKQWDELVANHGAVPQRMAIDDPVFADTDTEELMEHFFGEVARRAA